MFTQFFPLLVAGVATRIGTMNAPIPDIEVFEERASVTMSGDIIYNS